MLVQGGFAACFSIAFPFFQDFGSCVLFCLGLVVVLFDAFELFAFFF